MILIFCPKGPVENTEKRQKLLIIYGTTFVPLFTPLRLVMNSNGLELTLTNIGLHHEGESSAVASAATTLKLLSTNTSLLNASSTE